MSQSIESNLHELRTFAPPSPTSLGVPRWLVDSRGAYDALHRHSIEDPEGFWGGIAQELHWFAPWSRVLEWNVPDAKWFVGGKTNVCYNCVDRHVEQGHGDQVAILWEGEPISGKHGQGPEVRRITYNELMRDVSKFANALKSLGVKRGDVVTIYMGMVPEVAIAMLACARIGAVHSVIFGGFSSQAIVDRVLDANSRVIITCDGAYRRGSVVPLKESVDAACIQLAESGHPVESVVVYSRIGNQIAWHSGRDHSFKDLVLAASPDCPAEPMDAEDMLFLLYTSGSTGKPKGIVHTTGGYMVHTYLTSRYTFNLIPDENQLYWCTADVGWVTGHSYILYGVLANRVTTLMFEGAPNFPKEDRFWEIIERHKVTHFYTAPTAIRAFMKWGDEHPKAHNLSSLQILGTVGEPINPEAWMWYHQIIGDSKRPIVDTWWQTETGGHMITPLPGAITTKPGSCTLPFFGIDAAIVDEEGNEVPNNQGGLLVIRNPWPGMLRGIHGDRQRFIDTYFSRIPGMYFTGDGARRDTDGYFWVMGRVDDVINVSGHRLGTMEVESALVSYEAIVEAAVVGMPHEIKGTGIAAFVTLATGFDPVDAAAAEKLKASIREHVAKEIGAIAKPDQIRFTPSLPKTRSGKIMRRLLRSIAAGETRITQDTTTLEDYTILAKLSENSEG